MKKLFHLISVFCFLSGAARAQVNVQKGGAAGTNNITADLNIGTGRIFTIASGATFNIGTTTPATISGNNGALTLTGGGAAQLFSFLPSGTFFVSQSTPSAGQEFVQFTSSAAFALTANLYGIRQDYNLIGTGGGGTNAFGGASILGRMVVTGANNTGYSNRLAGLRGGVEHAGSAAADDLRAGDFSATITGTGSSSKLTAVYALLGIDAAANGGTIGTADGFFLPTVSNAGTATTITNLNGVHIAAQTAGTTNRAILTDGTTVSSFGGRVLVGKNTDHANGLVQILSSSSSTGLALGTAADDVLWKSAASTMKSGGAFVTTGTLTAGDDLLTAGSGSFDIGKTGARWRNLWVGGTSVVGGTSDVGSTLTVGGNISLTNAGMFISVKSGANAAAGTFTMVAGSATVNSTAIDANTVVVTSLKTVGGTAGIYTPLVTVGSSTFTATSVATDTSTYNWVALKVN